MNRTEIQIKFNETWYRADDEEIKYIYISIKSVLKVYILKKELEEGDKEIYRDLPDAFDAASVFLFLFDSLSLLPSHPSSPSLPFFLSLSLYAPKGACVIRRIEKRRVGI